MAINQIVDEIVIGDVSNAWLVDFKADGVAVNLDGFTCQMSFVRESDKEVIFSREITQIYENQFVIYLTDVETGGLKDCENYVLMAQISGPNETLPKPIKITEKRNYKAVGGFIQ